MLGPGWLMKPPDGLWKQDLVPQEDYFHTSMPRYDFRDKYGAILWLFALRWECRRPIIEDAGWQTPRSGLARRRLLWDDVGSALCAAVEPCAIQELSS